MENGSAKNFNVGDVLVSTFGYNRTINEFFLVARKTDKTIWVHPLKSRVTSHDGYMQNGYEVPTNELYGSRLVMCRINKWDAIAPYGHIAYRWDGKPKCFTSD